MLICDRAGALHEPQNTYSTELFAPQKRTPLPSHSPSSRTNAGGDSAAVVQVSPGPTWSGRAGQPRQQKECQNTKVRRSHNRQPRPVAWHRRRAPGECEKDMHPVNYQPIGTVGNTGSHAKRVPPRNVASRHRSRSRMDRSGEAQPPAPRS